jgi:Uma2 family endonuclease
MTIAQSSVPLVLPDHKQLPESDGRFVKNFQEHPQSLLLTSSISPILDAIHPDGNYAIGQDSGIYWRLTDPPERGAEAPDWFYVPNVPPLLDGERRRSYVMWKEVVAPLIAIEFTSGDGREERDATSPLQGSGRAGKFWVYEQAVRIPFYAIYEVEKASVEVYQLVEARYQRCSPNERGHFPIASLGVELGIWWGTHMNQRFPWLRWWDDQGNLLLTGEERAILEKERAEEADRRAAADQQRAEEADRRAAADQQRAEEADRRAAADQQRAEEADRRAAADQQRAEEADRRAAALAAKLRALGIDPEA